MMKNTLLAMTLALFSLTIAAQESIRVNYKGNSPTITDFVTAVLSTVDDKEEVEVDESGVAMKHVWEDYLKGLPIGDNQTLTVDKKNGFVGYESRYEEDLFRVEFCYWNEADKKHKLVAFSIWNFTNGRGTRGQYERLVFYRYDNATKRLKRLEDGVGFDVEYGTEDFAVVTYDLPRYGKDITVNYWYPDKKKVRTLKWNGRKFSLQ